MEATNDFCKENERVQKEIKSNLWSRTLMLLQIIEL